MAEPTVLEQTIEIAKGISEQVPAELSNELALLIKDLEEAKTTLFVRTAEAKPMIERCKKAAEALKAATGEGWGDQAKTAFDDFQRAVAKLRNTILVRTQRAT